MFTQANPVKDLGPECSAILADYAGLLASQGRLEVAATYLKGCHYSYYLLPYNSLHYYHVYIRFSLALESDLTYII